MLTVKRAFQFNGQFHSTAARLAFNQVSFLSIGQSSGDVDLLRTIDHWQTIFPCVRAVIPFSLNLLLQIWASGVCVGSLYVYDNVDEVFSRIGCGNQTKAGLVVNRK